MKRPLFLAILFLVVNAGYAQATFTNSVYNADFADPTVIRGHDGWFYPYATNTAVGDKIYLFRLRDHQTLFTGTLLAMPCL